MSLIIPHYPDETLISVLKSIKTIAVVGFSTNPETDSYEIGHFLKEVGFTVYAVNPKAAQIGELTSYPSLADAPKPVDLVSVFRKPEFLPGIVDEAAVIGAKIVWAQPGIINEQATPKAEAAHIQLLMGICIRANYRRLMK